LKGTCRGREGGDKVLIISMGVGKNHLSAREKGGEKTAQRNHVLPESPRRDRSKMSQKYQWPKLTKVGGRDTRKDVWGDGSGKLQACR